MVKLKTLINLIENNTNNIILGEYNEDSIIDEVLLMQDDKLLSHSVLYLTRSISKALLVKEYNVLVIVHRRRKDNSVLQLETSESIDEIYKLIFEFMLKEYKLYAMKCNIYNELYKCNDINEILNISEEYFNNPIFVLDTSYHIIGRSNLACSITSSIEDHNDESYLVSDVINVMKKEKCIDNIYNSSTAFFHFSDENLIFVVFELII